MNGFQQNLKTFKRVSGKFLSSIHLHLTYTAFRLASIFTHFGRYAGYCEQFDIHSPQSTVGEALWFSARTRLAPEVSNSTMNAFFAEVRCPYVIKCRPAF